MRALPAATGIDQPGMARAQILDVNLQLAAGGGQQAGEEHIGILQQAVQHLGRAFGAQIQRNAAFAAIPDLVHEGETTRARLDASLRQPAYRIARVRLDLDDIGPHVGQHRAGGGHEYPHGNLNNLNTL